MDDEVVVFDNVVPRHWNPNDLSPNLDLDEVEEELMEEFEDVEEVEIECDNNGAVNVTGHGVQQRYVEGIQKRVRYECSNKFGDTTGGSLNDVKWLLAYLRDHHWRISREDGPIIAKQLGLHSEHESYYPRVKIWLPDVQWGESLMPICPNCKRHMRPHGFQARHFGRVIIDQTDHYYIISRRYICTACKERKSQMVGEAKRLANAIGVEIEQKKVQWQYTFMAWDQRILPLYADGRGSEFPAFLTNRSGVDLGIIDLCRPLIDKGTRPGAILKVLLELHTKEFTKRNLRYERDYKISKRLQSNKVLPPFGEFADKSRYNGHVPTGRYLAHVYKQHDTYIRCYLDKEVKKRGADVLYWDVSYKICKLLCQYQGEAVFKGYVTALNEIGEIRLQFNTSAPLFLTSSSR